MISTFKLDLLAHLTKVMQEIGKRENTPNRTPKTYKDFILKHMEIITELPDDATEYRLPVIEVCEGRPIGIQPPLRFQFVYKEVGRKTKRYVDFLTGEELLRLEYFPIWLYRWEMQECYDDGQSAAMLGALASAFGKGRSGDHPGNDMYEFGGMNHFFAAQYELLRAVGRWEKVEWPDRKTIYQRYQDYNVAHKSYVTPPKHWWKDPAKTRSLEEVEMIIQKEGRF